jgi:hypothetical protein
VIRELARAHNPKLEDICAELSLRGMEQAKLPPALIEWITAEVRKIFGPESADLGFG